jgi:hypothetical protein
MLDGTQKREIDCIVTTSTASFPFQLAASANCLRKKTYFRLDRMAKQHHHHCDRTELYSQTTMERIKVTTAERFICALNSGHHTVQILGSFLSIQFLLLGNFAFYNFETLCF